ncbi:MAG: SIR2 family protein [Firmicutes bacterium]|nr:SIR2 family protein [Bacillota bacterium]
MLDLQDEKFNRIGNNLSTLIELTGHIKINRVIPFVGAGMSIDVYGSWGSALKRIMAGHIPESKAQDIQKRLIDKFCYEKAAEEICDFLGKATFYNQLTAVFGELARDKYGKLLLTDEKLQTMSVRYLPGIFNKSLVITTNFDQVLERSFQMAMNPFEATVALRHLSDWQAAQVGRGLRRYLIKIHGCVSAPDEVVMTKESYNNLYEKEPQHMERLIRIFSGNQLLFIGCSLDQDRTVDLLRKVGLGGHYAILPMKAGAEDEEFLKRKRIVEDELQMRCIWYPKENGHPQGEHHYVADILEYIDADVAGRIGSVEAVAPGNPLMGRMALAVKIKQPVQVAQPAAPNEPSGERKFLTAKVEKSVQGPQSAGKPPLAKNEIYTMGRWQNKPLEWLVLDVQSDRALLITRDCLLRAPYHEEFESVTWEQCTLRNKLLPELLTQIFDYREQERVKLWKNRNPDNEYWKTPGGAVTEDKLFLLSVEEAIQYFPDEKARVASLNGKAVFWWLRSPGDISDDAAYVTNDGDVHAYGFVVSWSEGSVRPAFWLNRQS